MATKDTYRLDVLVVTQHPHLSRTQAQSMVMQGKVRVDGNVVTKSGERFPADVTIDVIHHDQKFVSRAGYKLEHALHTFSFNVEGLVVLDAGISTGGFTDCLLQQGAKKVYGVDVGYGQVHEKIRNDPRLVLFERTNLRHMTSLPEPVDLATLDLSFISLLKVMPAVTKLVKPDAHLITLIKPQFEAERHEVKRGGVVKDENVYQSVLAKICDGMKDYGFELVAGPLESPLIGAKSGNKEFLALFARKCWRV